MYLLDGSMEHTAEHIGGKAYHIDQMINLGLPVPQGFVVPTNFTFDHNFHIGEKIEFGTTMWYRISSMIRHLASERNEDWTYNGDDAVPLVVSVRSGAPVSMPGMMDTILNIGLTRNNIDAFVKSREATKSFGLDCYRRLIQMHGVTVKGVEDKKFTEIYNAARTYYQELDEEAYQTLVDIFERIYEEEVGEPFTDDPNVQLKEAINAVFLSYFSEKAVSYRDIEGLNHNMGTAVTVQPMVFGNLENSATGVAFTHNPNTGEKGLYGDFLKGAQGEDVVAGTHKVVPIGKIFEDSSIAAPARELVSHMTSLLKKEKDILDIEFTIERGKLFILQYRVAKRSSRANIRSLMDMTRDGDISTEIATERFLSMLPKKDTGTDDPGSLDLIGTGLGVTEDEVVGVIATTHEDAEKFHKENRPFIYVATETNPNDVTQMKNALGILTATGGSLSHAAVVARGWGKSCVVSFEKMAVFNEGFVVNNTTYKTGDLIKINGSTGEVWA